jgi:zinc D-Ala-D-Ala carboxypeptidase
VTEHFGLGELVFSAKAIELKIDNTPPAEVLERLKYSAECLEKVRTALGDKPIRITSGYRCEALNRAVGGVKSSQHVLGEAVDFVCPMFGAPKRIVSKLASRVRELGIDQIICEGSWVHISFKPNPRHLVMSYVDGKFVKGVS